MSDMSRMQPDRNGRAHARHSRRNLVHGLLRAIDCALAPHVTLPCPFRGLLRRPSSARARGGFYLYRHRRRGRRHRELQLREECLGQLERPPLVAGLQLTVHVRRAREQRALRGVLEGCEVPWPCKVALHAVQPATKRTMRLPLLP